MTAASPPWDWSAWVAAELLAPIDVQLAQTLQRLVPQTSPWVVLAGALASRAVQQGHVCVDLRNLADTVWTAPEARDAGSTWLALPPLPNLATWLAELRASDLVATDVNERAPRPLVVDGQGRVYLYRYARYQHRLAKALRQRSGVLEEVDAPRLRAGLDRLFPEPDAEQQKHAAAVAVLCRFSVISGGPGTGKTFTVTRILALLQEQALALGRSPARISALAPTGKAAQRLSESKAAASADLDVSAEVRAALVVPTSTIHRALGFLPQTPTQFRHNQQTPLPTDVVVVDEASMVDLALMAKLVEAVPTTARLILLGDKDQLASVEAGSILADIYGDGARSLSAAMAERLQAVGVVASQAVVDNRALPGLGDGCVALTRSRRYGTDSDIGAVARAVNAGDGQQALKLVSRHAGAASVRLLPGVTQGLPRTLVERITDAFAGYRTASPQARLAQMTRFKILCAHRRGVTGAEWVNREVEAVLAAHDVLRPQGLWYDGRPLLVTANDPALGLYNGDVGVVCVDGAGVPLAHFATPAGDQATRAVAPARLPNHETVFAMTVHKSQGSEFERVALLLPEKVSPVLTRELLYTAITRAKLGVEIYASPEVFAGSIARHTARASGLGDELRAASPSPSPTERL